MTDSKAFWIRNPGKWILPIRLWIWHAKRECVVVGVPGSHDLRRAAQVVSDGEDLERDFQGLRGQLARDQAVAALHRTCFSLPYMDLRVVRTALAIPPEKKAMQYGSGVMNEMRRVAARKGFKRNLQEFVEDGWLFNPGEK
jgi:asparagine synthetase B (glutamine-hydrolysing)